MKIEDNTWEVTIRGKEVWKHYPIIQDTYKQTQTLKVAITDVTLKLSSYIPKLKTNEVWYIDILESYGVPRVYIQESDKNKITGVITRDKETQDLKLWVYVRMAGSYTLKLVDDEGNTRVLQVEVEGRDVSEEKEGEQQGEGIDESESDKGEKLSYDIESIFIELFQAAWLEYDHIEINHGDHEKQEKIMLKKVHNMIQAKRWKIAELNSLKSAAEILKSKYIDRDISEDHKELVLWILDYISIKCTLAIKDQWVSDGVSQAIEDYIYDITETLDPREFPELLKWITFLIQQVLEWNIPDQIEDISEWYKELYEIFTNLNEILDWLSDYKKSYYWSYIETIVAMELIPFKVWKLSKLKKQWAWDSKTLKEIRNRSDLLKVAKNSIQKYELKEVKEFGIVLKKCVKIDMRYVCKLL